MCDLVDHGERTGSIAAINTCAIAHSSSGWLSRVGATRSG
jgi:hypothetical protein